MDMTKQKKFHNKEVCEDSNLDYYDNNNEYINQYISENCVYCQEGLINIEDILVDDKDNYCCKDCDEYHKLGAVECRDID